MWCETVGCASPSGSISRTCRRRSRRREHVHDPDPRRVAERPKSSAVASASSSESVGAASGAQQSNVSINVNISKDVGIVYLTQGCCRLRPCQIPTSPSEPTAAAEAAEERELNAALVYLLSKWRGDRKCPICTADGRLARAACRGHSTTSLLPNVAAATSGYPPRAQGVSAAARSLAGFAATPFSSTSCGFVQTVRLRRLRRRDERDGVSAHEKRGDGVASQDLCPRTTTGLWSGPLIVFAHQIDKLCDDAEGLRTARAALPRWWGTVRVSLGVCGTTFLTALGGMASEVEGWFVAITGGVSLIAAAVALVAYLAGKSHVNVADDALNRHIARSRTASVAWRWVLRWRSGPRNCSEAPRPRSL